MQVRVTLLTLTYLELSLNPLVQQLSALPGTYTKRLPQDFHILSCVRFIFHQSSWILENYKQTFFEGIVKCIKDNNLLQYSDLTGL